jgi:hypothetical protein
VPAELVVKRAFALDTKRHLGIKGRYPGLLALPDRWTSWLVRRRAGRPGADPQAPPAGDLVDLPDRDRAPDRAGPAPPDRTALDRRLPRPDAAKSYPTAKLQRKAFQWIEGQTLKHCTLAVCTTHSAMQAYRNRFPDLAWKFRVIENGYDEDGLSMHGVGAGAARSGGASPCCTAACCTRPGAIRPPS